MRVCGWWRGAGAFLTLVGGISLGPALAWPGETVTFGSVAGGQAGLITTVLKKYAFDVKNGITVDLKLFDPAKMEEAVFFRRLDAGLFPPISAARAHLRGSPLQMFRGIMLNHTALLVRADVPGASVAELRGRKLGTLGRITALYANMALVLKQRGVDIERHFEVIIGTPPVLLGLFERGDLHTMIHFEPYVTRLVLQKKARELLRPNDEWKKLTGQPLLLSGATAYEDWIQKNRGAARALARAFADTAAFIRKNPQVAIEDARKDLGIRSMEEAELYAKRLPDLMLERWDREAVANARLMIERSVELGFLDRMPAGEVFVTLE
ncbi:MAG: ABC transporter substrate-binding protein [Deltaproteobacteria bacterium]|nr:ABC transporter substrate-binding protein [Deltaproteobacteria bacterium]MBI3075667.1 ABC transporter substrate-binding protein [Deltaproteobacteria bacterium]